MISFNLLRRLTLSALVATACGAEAGPEASGCTGQPDSDRCPVAIHAAGADKAGDEFPGSYVFLAVLRGAPHQSVDVYFEYSHNFGRLPRDEISFTPLTQIVQVLAARDDLTSVEVAQPRGDSVQGVELDASGILFLFVVWDTRGLYSTCMRLTLRAHVGRRPVDEDDAWHRWNERRSAVFGSTGGVPLVPVLSGGGGRLTVTSTSSEVTQDGEVTRVWAREGDEVQVEVLADFDEGLLPDDTRLSQQYAFAQIFCYDAGWLAHGFETSYERRRERRLNEHDYNVWILRGTARAGENLEWRCSVGVPQEFECRDFWRGADPDPPPLGGKQARVVIEVEPR